MGLPLFLFGWAAAAHDLWLAGDNLIQNYPLRVLAGSDLRHGHLPLWDPYLWSGSPLLAGFNAGAAYPLTALFAVLPASVAWVANQASAPVVGALGMLVLLRGQGRSWGASGLGAGAFSWGGFMAAQSVHLDLVQAGGWLVWAFAAMERLAQRRAGWSARLWVGLLGLSLGLMALTGAAEPMLDGGVVLVLYALVALVRARKGRVVLVAQILCAAALGAAVGAAQLLPGSAFAGQSQRAVHSFTYFASGSLNKSYLLLALDPLVLGGAHRFPLSFAGTYNLPEISSYLGIVPVMAVVGLLARRHRRSPEMRKLWVWYAVAATGVVLAWGAFSPLGHLEYLVPYYNRQRLLGRNLLEADIALAVLFAAWLDRQLLRPDPMPPATARRRWRSDVVLPFVPVAAVVLVQLTLLAGGPWLPERMHVPTALTRSAMWPLVAFLSLPSLLALGAGWLVVRGRQGRKRGTLSLLVALCAIDLAVFNVTIQSDPQTLTAADGSSLLAASLGEVVLHAGTGRGGESHRWALFDPDRYYPVEANELGEPDLNVLRQAASIQGYGAIVGAAYDAATGTHLQGNLSLDALGRGDLAQLDLGIIVTAPEYFVHVVAPAPGVPTSIVPGATPIPPVPADRRGPASASSTPRALPPAPATPAKAFHMVPAPGAVRLASGETRIQYFGTVLAVRSVDLLAAQDAGVGPSLRVGLLEPDGRSIVWAAATAVSAGHVAAGFAAAPDAVGLVLQAGAVASPSLGPAVLRTAGQGTYRVDGGLRDLLQPPGWQFAGTIGPLSVFLSTHASGRAWLSASSGTAHVRSDEPWGTEVVSVRSPVATSLVRDVAYAPGWQATVSPLGGGPARRAAVVRDGLVQSVEVPKGSHLVTFVYRPRRALVGYAASGLGVLVALGLLLSARRGPGRRRRDVGARRVAVRSGRGPAGATPVRAPSAPGRGWAGRRPRGP